MVKMITLFEGPTPDSLGDMDSRTIMKKDLVSCTRRLQKSTSSNIRGKRRKVTFNHS